MTTPTRFLINLSREVIEDIFGAAGDGAFLDLLHPLLLGTMAGAANVWASVFAFALPDPDDRLPLDFGPLLRNHEPRLVEVNRATRLAVLQLVQQQLEDGQPYSAIATRLHDLVGLTTRQWEAVRRYGQKLERAGEREDRILLAVRRYARQLRARRAETIARTESGIAWALATRQQMRDHGVAARMWITSRDERVRGTHRPMDNQCRGLDEPFLTGAGVALMHPHDPAGPPEEIINCRCVEVPFPAGCGTVAPAPVRTRRDRETVRDRVQTAQAGHEVRLARAIARFFRDQAARLSSALARLDR